MNPAVRLQDLRLSFVDLQTTGATPESGNVLEMAWCVASAAEEKPELIHSRLIKQPEDQAVPGRITMITGITSEDMQQAVDLADAQNEFMQALQSSSNADSLVIHFAQFEKRFLEQAFPTQYPDWHLYCTHQIAARLFPNLPSRGIRGLSGYFGLHLEECKRAENHVLATFLIWRNLCKKLAEIGIDSLEQLNQWLADTRPGKRTKYEYPLDKTIRLSMPDSPGIYRMLSCTGEVLYVGKATSLRSRVNSYFRGQRGRDSRKLEMLTQTWNIRHTVCDTVVEACLLEVEEIKRLTPPYNVAMKIDDRPLIYYAEDFAGGGFEQTEEHSIGPFRSEIIMDPFVRLWTALRSAHVGNVATTAIEFDPLMFFDELPQELLQEGFSTLLQRHNVSHFMLASPRSLLAWGLRLRRMYAARDEDLTADDQDTTPDPETPEELTPEDVADKYERLLMRSARSYRLARRLTHLLHAIVEFQECGKLHVLAVANGQLCWRSDTSAELTPHAATLPWKGLTLDTFDRLRVLQTELSRIVASGGHVKISSLTPPDQKRKRPRAKLEGASAFS